MGVLDLIILKKIDVLSILETKLNSRKMEDFMKKRLANKCNVNNFDVHEASRILVVWNPKKSRIQVLDKSPQFVLSTSYSLSVNGGLYGFFEGKKKLRQGDPLSPILFVVCMEYLSRLLKNLESDRDYKFHPKCGDLKISHLAFADDLILFARGDYSSVKKIMECLGDLSDCSGLRANLFKSNMIDGLLDSWPRHTISYAGKLELINFVIQGVDYFWLSIFLIPYSVLAHIVKLCRAFLWGGRRRPLVAWKDVCLPKQKGGLGVMDLKFWNKALLTRTFGNIRNKKDALWSKDITSAEIKLKQWDMDRQFKCFDAYQFWRNKGRRVLWLYSMVGNHLRGQLGISISTSTIKASLKWLHKEARGTGIQAVAKKACFATTTYYLWHFRNESKFEGLLLNRMSLSK
ncbi:uncharacterized protein LOC131151213 [Malania oleifera]|uniref:uncharacterized protein LOC131151213 n=1 Tax=Malania oleifera TaxID=397392 RepID=UPI0025ADDF26|nr:uncharacterized protein LOC131151213 [Malania oleifera]